MPGTPGGPIGMRPRPLPRIPMPPRPGDERKSLWYLLLQMKLWPNVILGTRDESLRMSSFTRHGTNFRDWKIWPDSSFTRNRLLVSLSSTLTFSLVFPCFSTELLHKPIPTFGASSPYREQQQRRRLRKRHLKSEFALLQTLSRLFHLVQFVKCWQFFLELNSKILYQSSGKKRNSLSCVHVFHKMWN